MIKLSFQTFGCKLNFSETSTIMNSFDISEYQLVKDVRETDFHIIHSCTVTDQAEKKCRQAIRRTAKLNPDVKIIVIGCYSQLHPKELEEMPNVIFVCGNETKFKIKDLIDEYISKNNNLIGKNDEVTDFQYHTSISKDTRTRTFLKIQDGCNYFCTYCAVPYARGRSRSDTIENVIKIAKNSVESSSKEIVLSGVNLGDFSNDKDENLYMLLSEMINVQGLERIRISSIEPNLLESRIIDLAAQDNNIMPHFHIPLQAGSDKILSMMKRRYDTSFFKDKIDEIKSKIPDVCIAVDLITGFPGEDEKDFEETCEFIKLLGISYLHIFSYSDRPEAVASKFDNKVKPEEIIRRSKVLHQISEEMHADFIKRYSGSEREVLFEMKNKNGKWVGWTDNYIRSEFKSDDNLKNKIIKTIITPYNTNS